MTATQEVRPGTPPSRGRRKSKQENMFGPYSLLYTIGEGEFAKVKYGIHSESGSESAIKLIRKENVDTEKLSKIKREISVLKSLQHPYIVKLVEVIETQNYIGIVLEFASGGELFDHILAHRYLKEQEASRLFAQLICGVDYLHRNKIIHRDLKLENLLLDRDRNIIITDFGFANQFGKNGEDLMATSCGSPCYAAPELVVSDGMYAGSAVDVWSCGVILYAMLAGFLPYDDDPANPEGDNINLLYKYILSTPLSFPDYIGSDARDLLKRMLVPDPAKRCKIKDIMNHRWLAQYKGLFEVFILKAKLEFVTGSPSSPEIISSSPESKSKRQVFEADSSPFIAEKVIAGKGLLDTLDSELSDAQILPETPQEKESLPTGSAPIEVNLTKQNHPSCSTIESGYEFSHHLDNGLDSGMSVPLSPLEPAAGALVSHQAYNSFGPNSVVTYNNRSYDRPEVDESRHEFRRHHSTRKEKTSFTPVANVKANKARPVSMQPVPSKQRKASGRPSYDGTYDHGTHVASTSRSNRATHGRRHSKSQNDPTVKVVTVMDSTSPKPAGSKPVRPASMDPNNARYGVYSTPQLDVLNEPTRRSNRRDERKAMSVAMSSFPLSEPLNDPIRQSTLSPTTNTAQRITDWIKRKSVIIKAGSTPNVPPMNATLADLSSYGEQRSGVALPRGSFNLPRENGPAYRLRYHRGAVDQFALTSRDPSLVMSEVRLEVVSMGFIIDKASDFKFKITRPARETGTSSHSSSRRFTLVGLRDLLQILPRSSNSSPRGGARSYPSAPDSLYGEPSIDNGEEMKLSLELCKIKNFPNLYSLDIKRIKGNVWSYKFLYHFILEQLQLNSNGGYLNP